MLSFNFEIGKEEKHKIDILVNHIWGYILIEVDGKAYIRKKLTRFKLQKSWTFNLKIDKQEVKIELISSPFPVGLRECTAWVYIDGEKPIESIGRTSSKNKLFAGMSILAKIITSTALFLIFSILAGSIIYTSPIRINTEMEGVLFRGGIENQDYSETMTIVIDGKYKRHPFSYNTYTGKFYIDEMNPAIDQETLQQEITMHFANNHPATMHYLQFIQYSFSEFLDLGLVYMKPNGNELYIMVNELDENGKKTWLGSEGGLFFAAPCETREEAIDIVNELLIETWGDEILPIE